MKGNIVFEGVYLNGIRWKEKYRQYDDKLKFEGEYLSDFRKKEKNILMDY